MYEAFYKLRGKPFRLTPDADMLFPSTGHKRGMSYLLYGLEQGEGFVIITGAVGTGKTLLIQTLLETLAHRNMVIASIASANLDSDDILPAVASEFGLSFEGRGKEALLQDVKHHLMTLGASHSHALLVVDEAQTLTPAALEMLRILSNLELDGRALIQVFLVGQGELRLTMINNHLEQLRQRVVASYRLEPMDTEETSAYILHRLRTVDWADDPQLDPGIFDAVHRASRGIPRRINLIMDRLLLFGFLEERHHLDQEALTTVLKEMNDEMAGVPQTIEPDPDRQLHNANDEAPAKKREDRIAALEHKYNRLLLRVIRQETQLDKVRKSVIASDCAGESTPPKGVEILHPTRKGR